MPSGRPHRIQPSAAPPACVGPNRSRALQASSMKLSEDNACPTFRPTRAAFERPFCEVGDAGGAGPWQTCCSQHPAAALPVSSLRLALQPAPALYLPLQYVSEIFRKHPDLACFKVGIAGRAVLCCGACCADKWLLPRGTALDWEPMEPENQRSHPRLVSTSGSALRVADSEPGHRPSWLAAGYPAKGVGPTAPHPRPLQTPHQHAHQAACLWQERIVCVHPGRAAGAGLEGGLWVGGLAP